MSLAAIEAGVRVFAPPYLWQFRDATADWQLDSSAGWVQKGDLDVTTIEDDGKRLEFKTNADGLRPASATRRKNSNSTRIIIFGDSTVVGRSVAPDRTVDSFLSTKLKSLGQSVEVINAGVQGYSTDQVLIRIRQLVPLYSPDIVVYGFCSNDLGGISVRNAYGLAKPSFVFEGSGLKEIKPDIREKNIPTFDSGPRKWIQSLAIYRFLHPEIVSIRSRFGNWQERNLLGTAPEIYYRQDELEKADWKLFGALLAAMKETAAKGNARFFFYAHPDIAEVWDPYIKNSIQSLNLDPSQYDRYRLEKHLAKTAEENGVLFCPLVAYFLQNEQRGPFHLLPRDPHCNSTGYQVTSEALARFLVDSRMLSPGEVEGNH